MFKSLGIVLILLFLPLGAEASYSQLEREEFCRNLSNYLYEIAYFRDEGVSEKEMLSFISASEEMSSGFKEATLYNIKRIYARTDLTAEQIAKMNYESCINPPREV